MLTVLQRTARVVEQVEHSSAKPADMDNWESYRDQDRTHDQLATSVIGSGERLEGLFGRGAPGGRGCRR